MLGWVPLEEYTFFVVETILAGLWLLFLARRLFFAPDTAPLRTRFCVFAPLLLVPLWVAAVAILVAGWRPGTYLALELGWALPPIMLQLIFGADILWRYRRLVLGTLASLTVYLSATDALAIGSGTWTISPQQSLHVLLGGVLPVEEVVFFLLTAALIVLGMVLLLARESQDRVRRLLSRD